MNEFVTADEFIDEEDRIVMHIDLDAFFASCEEVKNPNLKNKPVVIGANPKKGKGRGVVSTCNYKAREFGIKSAMPISFAYKKCPKAFFLPVNMTFYSKVSKEIMKTIKSYGKKFQQVSIDEAFIEPISEYDVFELAKKIQNEIYTKKKITCSIGIAPNKLVAKIASDFRKPNAITIVKSSEIKMFLSPLDIRKLPGIGEKSEKKLKDIGIKTVSDLQNFPIQKLEKIFGVKTARYLKRISLGKDDSEVEEKGKRKSLGKEVTFSKDISDKQKIYNTIEKLAEKCYMGLRKKKINFRTINIKIRYDDFSTHTKQRTFQEQKNLKEMKLWSKELAKKFLKDDRKIRLVGVSFSKLSVNKV